MTRFAFGAKCGVADGDRLGPRAAAEQIRQAQHAEADAGAAQEIAARGEGGG